MDIHERLNFLIENLDLNPSSFAYRLGTSPSVIYNIVGRRKSKPSFDLLSSIHTTFKTNTNWLITGEGEMFLSSNLPTNSQDVAFQFKELAMKHISVLEQQLGEKDRKIEELQRRLGEEGEEEES